MVPKENLKVGILAGPTASGKSQFAIHWASKNPNYEIINADSLNIYREMDIGTAKPSLEERRAVTHHLIDIRNPNEPYTAADFVRETWESIQKIHAQGRRALIVGGSGFYLKALLFGVWEAPAAQPELRHKLSQISQLELFEQVKAIDPNAAQRIGSADNYRLIRALEIHHMTGKTPSQLEENSPTQAHPQFELWVIDRPQAELFSRIEQRTSQMLKNGLIEEFKKLSQKYPQAQALQSIGYAQVKHYLENIPPKGRKLAPGLIGLQAEIELATRQLVKKQRTWFKNLNRLVPESKWFYLDQDLFLLEQEINKKLNGATANDIQGK